MTTKVLVTGARSQLAKTLKEVSEAQPIDIQFLFLDKEAFDLTNFEQVESILKAGKFDYCVNCAAYTNVDLAETEVEQAFLVNAEAVEHLAQMCKSTQTRLIHISTDYVFDGNSGIPYKEAHATNPINKYGQSKRLGEEHIQSVLKEYFIIRASWLYSKYQGNFVYTIVDKIKSNSNLEITDSQKGSPTSASSLSKFILFLIDNKIGSYGVYHFSDQVEITWYDFALEIALSFKNYNSKKIKAGDSYKTKAKRPVYSVLDNSKVNEIYSDRLDWKSELDDVLKAHI